MDATQFFPLLPLPPPLTDVNLMVIVRLDKNVV
jgi:hypothetical protein